MQVCDASYKGYLEMVFMIIRQIVCIYLPGYCNVFIVVISSKVNVGEGYEIPDHD